MKQPESASLFDNVTWPTHFRDRAPCSFCSGEVLPPINNDLDGARASLVSITAAVVRG